MWKSASSRSCRTGWTTIRAEPGPGSPAVAGGLSSESSYRLLVVPLRLFCRPHQLPVPRSPPRPGRRGYAPRVSDASLRRYVACHAQGDPSRPLRFRGGDARPCTPRHAQANNWYIRIVRHIHRSCQGCSPEYQSSAFRSAGSGLSGTERRPLSVAQLGQLEDHQSRARFGSSFPHPEARAPRLWGCPGRTLWRPRQLGLSTGGALREPGRPGRGRRRRTRRHRGRTPAGSAIGARGRPSRWRASGR